MSPTADTADVEAVIDAGQTSGALRIRTDEIYLVQLPCLYWPAQPATADRPAPLTHLGVPLIVLGARLDPITPIEFGRAIAERADDGYLVETSGGPHVTFARGDPCVDRVVVQFLLEARLPSQRTVNCRGEVADGYYPLSALRAAEFEDAMEAMTSVQNELYAEPDYLYWDGGRTLTTGCRFGGTVTIVADEARESYTFEECAYAQGMALTGRGDYHYESDRVKFSVSFPNGSLEFESRATGRSVSGTFRGKKVDQSD
jgi:hypothetical protein